LRLFEFIVNSSLRIRRGGFVVAPDFNRFRSVISKLYRSAAKDHPGSCPQKIFTTAIDAPSAAIGHYQSGTYRTAFCAPGRRV
jgi:hypothetical protein